ncbi:hypothetical protein ACFE04_023922 [Oxalis oulophora]
MENFNMNLNGGGFDQSTPSDMQARITAVESVLNYRFKNKHLVEEALTHARYHGTSYCKWSQIAEDGALALAISNHLHSVYPNLSIGQMSILRYVNCNSEKLARLAVKLGLSQLVKHNSGASNDEVREFAAAVSVSHDYFYASPVKAPKILADFLQSLANAIFIDTNSDMEALWTIFKPLMEPILGLEDLSRQQLPLMMLLELCQKEGKQIDTAEKWPFNKFTIYTDATLSVSGSSEIEGARQMLDKLSLNNKGKGSAASGSGTSHLDGTQQVRMRKMRFVDGGRSVDASSASL